MSQLWMPRHLYFPAVSQAVVSFTWLLCNSAALPHRRGTSLSSSPRSLQGCLLPHPYFLSPVLTHTAPASVSPDQGSSPTNRSGQRHHLLVLDNSPRRSELPVPEPSVLFLKGVATPSSQVKLRTFTCQATSPHPAVRAVTF